MFLGFCPERFEVMFRRVVLQLYLAADAHLKLLGSVVSGVLECNLSHCQSIAVLCMLCKIRSNPMHPLCGALPVTLVPVEVTCM